jgi:hypothetical protein
LLEYSVFHLNLPSCMTRVGSLPLDRTPAQRQAEMRFAEQMAAWRVVLASASRLASIGARQVPIGAM